jgi:hypothetical protein
MFLSQKVNYAMGLLAIVFLTINSCVFQEGLWKMQINDEALLIRGRSDSFRNH